MCHVDMLIEGVSNALNAKIPSLKAPGAKALSFPPAPTDRGLNHPIQFPQHRLLDQSAASPAHSPFSSLVRNWLCPVVMRIASGANHKFQEFQTSNKTNRPDVSTNFIIIGSQQYCCHKAQMLGHWDKRA